ncbi:MAG TPA: S8 family serine peptidase [Luteolibacter sp.]
MRSPRWLPLSLLLVACGAGGYLLVRTASVTSEPRLKPAGTTKPQTIDDFPAPTFNSGERPAVTLRTDDEAIGAGAIAGQRFIVFADQAALERFLAKAKGKAISVLGRMDALNALRIGFLSADDLASLLDGSEKKGLLFPVLVPDLPQGGVQAGAKPFGGTLISWLGVSGYDRSTWGSGVTVAVLDTGVSALAGLRSIQQINLIDLPSDPSTLNGHGTAVASLILQVAPETNILSIRLADDLGSSNSWLLSQGIVQAVDSGAQIINISMGSYGDSALLREAVGYAQARGVVVVASAGNEGIGQLANPAGYPGVIASGSIEANGDHLLFSNTGAALDVSAPGYGLYSTGINGETLSYSGTSASAGVTTGTIAATMSNPITGALSATDASSAMMANLDESGPAGSDDIFGGGALNLGRVIQRRISGIVDAAVASHWIDEKGMLEVTVQNQGTAPIYNANVEIVTASGSTPVNVSSLTPGQTQTFTVPGPSGQAPATFQSTIRLSSGQIDIKPSNNQRIDVYTPATAP